MEACCEGDREKSNKKRHEKQMKEKHEKKKGPINKKTWSFSGKVFVLKKVKRKMQEFFEKREKQEERENTKEHFSLLRTNQQETHFQKKNQYKRNQIKNNMAFSEKKKVCNRRKDKRREKRWSNRTESSEKAIHEKWKQQRKNIQEREQKRNMFKNKWE